MTTKRILQSLISYLQTRFPDASVVDATQAEKTALPCIAVAIPSAEAHSIAMSGVMRCEINLTLREHSGDDETELQDMIEQALNDPGIMTALLNGGMRMDHWQYEGATESWDESVRETEYAANCLAIRV
jgi:hypothetical protein